MCDGIIFGCGIIRRVWKMQHLKICTSLADFVALAKLDDNYVVIRVARFANQAFDASLERLQAVGTRNDDGNFSRFEQLASDTKGVGAPVHGNMRGLAAASQVSFNCAPRSFELSRFLANVARAGILAPPPMV